MDLTQLANLGEFIGGVAVLVTLVYLALQVRLNTQSNRYLFTQNLVTNEAHANLMVATHGDLAEIIQNTATGQHETLAPTDRLRMNAYMYSVYSQIDMAYHQYRAGQLEERVWQRWDYEIPVFLGVPGFAMWWTQDKQRFSSDFVRYVYERLAAAPPPETVPTVGRQEAPRGDLENN